VREPLMIAEKGHADKAGMIGDDHVRESHVALNGGVVPVKESFSVGGYAAAYPGHWRLPAAERVNCKCTQIGAFSD